MTKDINRYIAQFPTATQKRLKQLRTAIRRAAPQSTETISYGMPTFKQEKNLVHFAGYKSHIGFYPTPSAIEAFKKQLMAYKTSKGAIQFPLDKPLPLALVQQIVKFRLKEDKQGGAKKKAVARGVLKTCSRGHEFRRSSDCPVCPKCWAGYYREQSQSDFPKELPAPALRALLRAKITKLSQLTKHTEKEIADLHGMGPKGITMLKASMRQKKLAFASKKAAAR